MEHENRDEVIRKKVLNEINEISQFTCAADESDFLANKMMQKAVIMSLINIGELTKAFSEEYTAGITDVTWRDIRGFRNIAAHHYGKIDMRDVWKTVQEDIPLLKQKLTEYTAR